MALGVAVMEQRFDHPLLDDGPHSKLSNKWVQSAVVTSNALS
jgi:hypothetical protein